jgi:hypothetical protein
MAAATWDSAYCLALFNRLTGRTGTDSITSTTKYQMLSEAQDQLVADIAAICPHVLYPTAATASLPTLTISAAGDIGTFGTDANLYAKFPMGHGNIFESLSDIPTNPFLDYMNEGTQIRALNNTTLPSTLYWYGISQPADINATDQPAIKPEPARELISLRAAYNFGTEGNRNVALARRWPRGMAIRCTTASRGGSRSGVRCGRASIAAAASYRTRPSIWHSRVPTTHS